MDPTKKELYTAKRSSGLDTSSDPNVETAISDIKSETTSTNWILFKIAFGQPNASLQHFKSGSRSDELKQQLSEDEIFFGLIRLHVQERIKFYNISYIGSNVSGMKKGKSSLFKAAVFGITEAHGEISPPSDLSDFTEDFLFQEVSRLSGSPKSNISF
eukprot:gene27974-36860_t